MTKNSCTADFVTLWTANSRQVYEYIVSQVPRWADADEILQETGLTAWEKFGDFQLGTNFTGWACRIAQLKMFEARRRGQKLPVVFTDVFLTAVESEIPSDDGEENPRYAVLLDCLQKFSPRDRELIGKRYQDGATTAGVAAAMGRTTSWAYKTLTRLHWALFECVEQAMRREAGS